MSVIKMDDLVESIGAALQFISYYHPADYIRHLARAYETEQSPAAKDAIAQILTNSRMSAQGHRPICQDTGVLADRAMSLGAHARIGQDLCDCVFCCRTLLGFVRPRQVSDVVGGMVVADELECCADRFDEIIHLDYGHAGLR